MLYLYPIAALYILLYSTTRLVSAQLQDCPLPNKTEIETALVPLMIITEGDFQSYSPNVTGPIQYVCLAQGSMIDTYRVVSLIATFTPNSGEPEQTKILSMHCINSGTWSVYLNDGLRNPSANLSTSPRTDCVVCGAVFGDDQCRECIHWCDSGLRRCTSILECCLVFTASGYCDDSCESDGPNYVATVSTGFVCTCNLTCPDGFTVNSNCTDCDFNICDAESPCMNGGQCIQNSPADNYTCDCTGTGYEGVNCTGLIPNPSSLTPIAITSPSLDPCIPLETFVPCGQNCDICKTSSCCKTCSLGYYLNPDDCTCGCCTVSNCSRCHSLNSSCCMECEEGFELCSDCQCRPTVSSMVDQLLPTGAAISPTENTKTRTWIVLTFVALILILCILIFISALVYTIIYFASGGAKTRMNKAISMPPVANVHLHNNPLYVSPEEVTLSISAS